MGLLSFSAVPGSPRSEFSAIVPVSPFARFLRCFGTNVDDVARIFHDYGITELLVDAGVGIMNSHFGPHHLDTLVRDLKTGSYGLTTEEVNLLLEDITVQSHMWKPLIPRGLEGVRDEVIVQYFALSLFKNLIVNYKNTHPDTVPEEIVGRAVAHALNTLFAALDRLDQQSFVHSHADGQWVLADEVVKVLLDLVLPQRGATLLFTGERAILGFLATQFLPSLLGQYLQDYVITKNHLENVLVSGPSSSNPSQRNNRILMPLQTGVRCEAEKPKPQDDDCSPMLSLSSMGSLPSLTLSVFMKSIEILNAQPEVNGVEMSPEVIKMATAVFQGIRSKYWDTLSEFLMPKLEHLLPEIDPLQTEDQQSPRRKLYHKLLTQILSEVPRAEVPTDTPAVLNYIVNKFSPLLSLLLQGFLDEGKRIQQENLAVSDKVLILTGAYSVAVFLLEEMSKNEDSLEDKIQKLKNRFPAFAAIHLPPKLQNYFLELLTSQLVNIFSIRNEMKAYRDGERIVNEQLHSLFGLYFTGPIDVICTFIEHRGRIIHQQMDCNALCEILGEFGFAISPDDFKTVVSIITGGETEEFKNPREEMLGFLRLTIKTMLVKVGTVARRNPNLIMELIQQTILKLGEALQTDANLSQEEAEPPNLYSHFILSLLAICGLQGPEDLNFCPKMLQTKVWDSITDPEIAEQLKTVFVSLFDADVLRKMIIDTLRAMNRETETIPPIVHEVQEVSPHILPVPVMLAEELPIDEGLAEAVGQIFVAVVDFLNIPFLQGRGNQELFKQTWGRRVSKVLFPQLRRQFSTENGHNPLLRMITDVMLSVVPALQAQIQGRPHVSVEVMKTAEEQSMAEAMQVKNELAGRVKTEIQQLQQIVNAIKATPLENQVRLAELDRELTRVRKATRALRVQREQAEVIINTKILVELRVAQRRELIDLLCATPKILATRAIKATWEGIKEGVEMKARTIFGRLFEPIYAVDRSTYQLLTGMTALLRFSEFVLSLSYDFFWFCIEKYVAGVGTRANDFLDGENNLEKLQKAILKVPPAVFLHTNPV